MDPFESKTQVFILRLWLEPREIEGAKQEWRGVIEHVPTGERSYFRRVEDLPKLILPYLNKEYMTMVKRESIGQDDTPSTLRRTEAVRFLCRRMQHGRFRLTWLARLQEWLRHRW